MANRASKTEIEFAQLKAQTATNKASNVFITTRFMPLVKTALESIEDDNEKALLEGALRLQAKNAAVRIRMESKNHWAQLFREQEGAKPVPSDASFYWQQSYVFDGFSDATMEAPPNVVRPDAVKYRLEGERLVLQASEKDAKGSSDEDLRKTRPKFTTKELQECQPQNELQLQIDNTHLAWALARAFWLHVLEGATKKVVQLEGKGWAARHLKQLADDCEVRYHHLWVRRPISDLPVPPFAAIFRTSERIMMPLLFAAQMAGECSDALLKLAVQERQMTLPKPFPDLDLEYHHFPYNCIETAEAIRILKEISNKETLSDLDRFLELQNLGTEQYEKWQNDKELSEGEDDPRQNLDYWLSTNMSDFGVGDELPSTQSP
ncbi:hypothetical protein P3342_011057 [Pyrenophora teres f. teres]|uniref:Uncharacterized protein n=1 Tax=Pyrenophora teres f. teres TaxID=97479 RepID=A0A6S6WD43_9PLEO|nr:hypothetical protein PTNB85_10325 [Pyrenophora teres f. teres]KAE8832071.1 hypothetical protein HRS9139_06313 [Pyrenophora teres f. teres]KAE8858094.1 hypothetical protein PTNB29_07309 [Pyrenophora teres f. teres]KAE8862068.1 hypothetical protein PTNB73_07622 [Pyrenophora teres f. teres]KAK1908981.1 hypothetical protein P3342_011057 [Pyrenophora teres f. teres]